MYCDVCAIASCFLLGSPLSPTVETDGHSLWFCLRFLFFPNVAKIFLKGDLFGISTIL